MNVQRFTKALRCVSRLPEVTACVRTLSPGLEVAASYVGLREMPLPQRVRFRNGPEYQLREFYDLETLWQINFHRVYPLASTDAVIVDAGANVGLFSCWAAVSNPRSTVYAVEPSLDNLDRLQDHIRANRLEARVSIIRAALSGTESTVWLSTCASASQMFHVVAEKGPDSIPVPALTFAGLLARVREPHIDFFKMDIEGSEYATLLSAAGADLRRVRRFSIEYHKAATHTGELKAELCAHLRACGFTRIDDMQPGSAYGMIHASRE
jgi:FkbM family methyltransferase